MNNDAVDDPKGGYSAANIEGFTNNDVFQFDNISDDCKQNIPDWLCERGGNKKRSSDLDDENEYFYDARMTFSSESISARK